jgi:hypothetical protein
MYLFFFVSTIAYVTLLHARGFPAGQPLSRTRVATLGQENHLSPRTQYDCMRRRSTRGRGTHEHM